MQYIELSPVAAFLLRVNIITETAGLVNIITAPAARPSAYLACAAVMIFMRPAVALMIFTRSRNAAMGDNSMYCMIPDPFRPPAQRLVKGRLRQTRQDYQKDRPFQRQRFCVAGR